MIFHIPLPLDENPQSASGLRPLKMIDAFKNIGYDVYVVAGTAKERRKKINSIKKEITKGVKFDFCYSESSTMPTLLTEKHHLPTAPFLDFGFFRFLKKRAIPLGLFYRDIHWLFEQYKKGAPFFKRTVAKMFYHYDLLQYIKTLDILFLPSLKMSEYIPFRKKFPKLFSLPPGCEMTGFKRDVSSKSTDKLRLIYAGGIKPPLYDLSPLFKALKSNDKVCLNLICRQNELELTEKFYNIYQYKNLTVSCFDELKAKETFLTSDIYVILWKPFEYLKFAYPYKLFEAFTWELPVLTTEGTAVADFVRSNNIGWVVDHEREDIFSDTGKYFNELTEKICNIKKIKNENTWEARARFVVEKLNDNDEVKQ